ncbi:MAG: hypothetical protein QM813_27695 [Verrucomicrobiota bacterium]
MKPKAITTREFEWAGESYVITVREYDLDLNHVTADWWRESDHQTGGLGFGVSDCESAIRLAEQQIEKEPR